MKYFVSKSGISGELSLPPSKSQSLRALLFGLLAKGETRIYHPLDSPDVAAMCRAAELFGAKVKCQKDLITIMGISTFLMTENVIDAGNSGLVLRFCTALGALGKHPVVVTGDHSIRHQRPMKPLLDGLRGLGVSAISMRGDDMAPVIIQGPIQPGSIQIRGEDSQPVSALLIAAAFAQGPIQITVNPLEEKPWVQLTLAWLRKFGIACEEKGDMFYLKGKSKIDGFEYHVPGDLSSAAFPLAAALITGSEVTLSNCDLDDPQGDGALINVFSKMGARIDWEREKKLLHVKKSGMLKGVYVNCNDFIDAVPILAAVACFAEGTTHITGASIARNKESNRLFAIKTELQKMGARISETEDGLIIEGATLKGAQMESHKDHRIAMALTVAALGASGSSEILDVDCVAKTFPGFLDAMRGLSAKIDSASS